MTHLKPPCRLSKGGYPSEILSLNIVFSIHSRLKYTEVQSQQMAFTSSIIEQQSYKILAAQHFLSQLCFIIKIVFSI